MSNVHHLTRGYLDRLCGVLFTGALELDRSRLILTERVDVFSIGDRIIAPPTPGALDPAYREGGPGEVVGVREDTASGEPFVYVVLDDSSDGAQPFRADELKREPTV